MRILAALAACATAEAVSWLELPRPRGFVEITDADTSPSPVCVDTTTTPFSRGTLACAAGDAGCYCGRAALAVAASSELTDWEADPCAYSRAEAGYTSVFAAARVAPGEGLCVAWAPNGHESDADRNTDHGYGGGVRVALSPEAAPSMAQFDAGVIGRLDFEDYAGAEVLIPDSVQDGLYTLQFLWETAGEVYANCADVVVTSDGSAKSLGLEANYFPGGSCGSSADPSTVSPVPTIAAGEAVPEAEDALICRTSEDAKGTYSVAERPRGLHWDVEPHTIDAWSTEREVLSARYLQLLELLRDSCMATSAADLVYTADLQMHYDTADANELTIDGETATLFDFVSRLVDSALIMSYRDWALGTDSVTYNAETEVGNTEGVEITVALETMDTGTNKVDFSAENTTYLEYVFDSTFRYFRDESNFETMAVHDYTHYSSLPDAYTLIHSTNTKRGLFLWETATVYTSSLRTAFLEFVDSHAIHRVYIDAQHLQESYPSQLAQFIHALALRRIETELLYGRSEWVYSSGQADAFSVCQIGVAYVDGLALLAPGDECPDGEVEGAYVADDEDDGMMMMMIAGAAGAVVLLAGGVRMAMRRRERETTQTKVQVYRIEPKAAPAPAQAVPAASSAPQPISITAPRTEPVAAGGSGSSSPASNRMSPVASRPPPQAQTMPGGVAEEDELVANMRAVKAARGSHVTPHRKSRKVGAGGQTSPALVSRRRGGVN